VSVPYFRITRPSASPIGPRLGRLITAHGEVETPAFLPVATQATVKALAPQDLRELGCQIVIANTYHLGLRPGVDLIERMGGLHGFMAWDGPIATDSGGFQVTSLAHRLRISDEALTFRSHLDGTPLHLSPEGAVLLQERLGADVLMCLDQPVSFGPEEDEVRRAMERTHLWAERCARAHRKGFGLLYGIVQGGTFPELRERSARAIGGLDVEGFAIGGLSLGEPKAVMWEMADLTVPLLPDDRPRHLLGVGSPEDLVEGVARGIDTFDCALPTRTARNGGLYTPEGRVDILNARFREEEGPVMHGCDCAACQTFSAAYLHHLFKAKELLAYRLASIHNLRFLVRLLEDARAAVRAGEFDRFRADFHARYRPADEAVREEQRGLWRRSQEGKMRDYLPPGWDADEDV
jgi:queuine tRNA-ribosyltransferase